MSNHYPDERRAKPGWEQLRREIPEFVEDVVAAAVRGYRTGKQKDGAASQPPSAEVVPVPEDRELSVPDETLESQQGDAWAFPRRRSPIMLLIVIGALLLAALAVSLAFNVVGFVFTFLSLLFGLLSGLFKVLAGMKGLAVLAFIPLVAILIVLFAGGLFQRRGA